MTEQKPTESDAAAARTNAPTSAGHHPAQPATPVSPSTHPNQPASIDNVEPKIPAAATTPTPAPAPKPPAPAPTAPTTGPGPGPAVKPAPGKPAAKPAKQPDPIVGEAQALRDEVEKLLKDDGVVRGLRDRHADLLARATDTLSRSDFAAATGILDVVAGLLNRLGPRD